MNNEKGMVMALGLLLLVVLTIIGLGAVSMVIFDVKISGNYDAANNAFYTADSGIEDTKARLMSSSPSVIVDNEPENPDWITVIGTAERAAQKGLSSATRLDRLEPSLDYFVTIKHKVNDSDITLKWGDANGDGIYEENTSQGVSIYTIIAEGWSKNGSYKSLQAEIVRHPPVEIPAAVYTKTNTTINGSSTMIIGSDACGTDNNPGIVSMGTITLNGSPTITGDPVSMVENSPSDFSIDESISTLKDYATHKYDYTSNTDISGGNWGEPFLPAQDQPSTCSTKNIVYFNMHDATLKLTGGTSGCGTLIVDGNLEATGGFNWHGLILVKGSVKLSGGGDKNITGGIMSGSTVSDDTISGNIVIFYCSMAVKTQTNGLPPVLLNWKD